MTDLIVTLNEKDTEFFIARWISDLHHDLGLLYIECSHNPSSRCKVLNGIIAYGLRMSNVGLPINFMGLVEDSLKHLGPADTRRTHELYKGKKIQYLFDQRCEMRSCAPLPRVITPGNQYDQGARGECEEPEQRYKTDMRKNHELPAPIFEYRLDDKIPKIKSYFMTAKNSTNTCDGKMRPLNLHDTRLLGTKNGRTFNLMYITQFRKPSGAYEYYLYNLGGYRRGQQATADSIRDYFGYLLDNIDERITDGRFLYSVFYEFVSKSLGDLYQILTALGVQKKERIKVALYTQDDRMKDIALFFNLKLLWAERNEIYIEDSLTKREIEVDIYNVKPEYNEYYLGDLAQPTNAEKKYLLAK